MNKVNFPSIRLHKNHMPIHPKVKIENQIDYDYHMGMLLYLEQQLNLGFNPSHMVTLHLKNSSDYLSPLRETINPYGYGDRIGFNSGGELWNQVAYDNYISSRRNNEFLVEDDVWSIRNNILKYLYGVKRHDQYWKYPFSGMLFFKEKGKVKLQYHIHILLPPDGLLVSSKTDIEEVLNTSVKSRAKCASRWKRIDAKPIESPSGAISYLNKETRQGVCSLDFKNSILIK